MDRRRASHQLASEAVDQTMPWRGGRRGPEAPKVEAGLGPSIPGSVH